jgi:hypothetical protein
MIEKISFLGFSLRSRKRRHFFVLTYYLAILSLTVLGTLYPNFVTVFLISQSFILGSLLGGIRADGPVKPYSRTTIGVPDGSGIQQLNLAGRRPLASFKPLDERERIERDRAHYTAYTILRIVSPIALVLCLLTIDFAPHLILRNALSFAWFLSILVMSLPQSVILWTEPEPLLEGDLKLVPEP